MSNEELAAGLTIVTLLCLLCLALRYFILPVLLNQGQEGRMKELQELIAYCQKRLDEARAAGDTVNEHFYAKTLELYQGATGPFWGLMLRELSKPDRETSNGI